MLWDKIQAYTDSQPDEVAIIGDHETYSWSHLSQAILVLKQQLVETSHQTIAFYAENCPAWVIVDVACQLSNITLLPLPAFFSDQQLHHAIKQAGVTAIMHQAADRIGSVVGLSDKGMVEFFAQGLVLHEIEQHPVSLPKSTAKITFTSGSTGQPKGVCLSIEQQLRVASSLLEATELSKPKHLSILPFSTLLENIGGIYAPLLSGGTIVALPQSALGFNGSSGFDLSRLLTAISHYQPNSMILLPELLMALVSAVKQGWQAPSSLQFIAVGGSKVSPLLLQQAQQCGLPVFEGYGLSECGSVVSVNVPNSQKLGSVGKVLSHVSVSIEDDEIVVSGNAFLGYINEVDSWNNDKVYTGDLGYFDEQQYLHISGRKKNLLISSFGRNINPEWVESELLANGLLQQCVVFGDAKPYCVALLYLRDNSHNEADIQHWIDTVNTTLPDYAQIKRWHRLQQPLSFADEFMTSNGRPVRANILQHFSTIIEQLY